MPKKSGNSSKKRNFHRSSRWDKDIKHEEAERPKSIRLKSEADFLNLKNIDLDMSFSFEGDMTHKKFDRLIRKMRRREKWKNIINKLKGVSTEEYVSRYALEKYQSNTLYSTW